MGPNKKGKIDLYPHQFMNYSKRRQLYLMKSPLSNISSSKLATNGTVLSYFQYVISCKRVRIKSTRNNRNTSDMICKYGPCNEAMEENVCLGRL